jgi:glycosyltransferase involved in cell wall biosynthesis
MNNNSNQLKGLFLNTKKASCSIYESGLMIYKALILSELYHLDYIEIDQDSCEVSNQYNFYIFNYHHTAMGWLDTHKLKGKLLGLKVTLVLEVSPNDPFVLCPKTDFDVYCTLDPTININDKRVYAFPRPLETFENIISYQESEIPVIGTFGFATAGKGFELVVEAVNCEFEEAIIKINIPPAFYADNVCWNLHKRNYAEYLSELCKKVAKPNIQVIVSHEYMTKEDLVQWCSQNTLNCFLYNRNQPGLSATTDQAISSGRPLAVSNNPTFRHIHTYIKPYPYQTLRESIQSSQTQVLKIQKDWNPINFAKQFEKVLQDNQSFIHQSEYVDRLVELDSRKVVKPKTQPSTLQKLISKIERKSTNILENLGYKKKKNAPPSIPMYASVLQSTPLAEIDNKILNIKAENTILIVSHKQKTCGIYQYGINITRALQKSSRYSFIYVECSREDELEEYITQNNPSVIIYNYYPAIMPWLNSQITRKYKAIQMGIMHEVTQEEADKATQEMFDYHLSPDPTLIENNPYVIKTPRLIIPYINSTFAPDVVTIGSFGFGFRDKGFEKLIETVQNEFDQARIVLHIPFNEIVDPEGSRHALNTAQRCRELVNKSGIELIINHEFLDLHKLLDFLAGNTLNAFFYDTNKERGISSCIEHALAVQRPISITKCGMFRHVFNANPSIYIENSSLNEIIDNGISPLVPFYNAWSEDNFILSFEMILDKVMRKDQYLIVNNDVFFNRILDNQARYLYSSAIQELFKLVPDMMGRKIKEANVQQAFVVDTVKRFAHNFAISNILCVGSYEDTAASTLKVLGYEMEEIDPLLNYDLNTFFHLPSTKKQCYQVIFSTSVLEHVVNDELFVQQIAELLAPDGVAILTCDYNDQYQIGDSIPDVDNRLYTQKDFNQRIIPLLKDCHLVDEPQWDCPCPDFVYAGKYRYTFATLVFQKNSL